MSSVRQQLRDEIVATIDDLNTRLPQGNAFNTTYGWNVPGISRDDLVRLFEGAIERIDRHGDLATRDDEDVILEKSMGALAYLRANTSSQLVSGNANFAVPVYALTAYALRDTLNSLWPELNLAEAERIAGVLRNSKRRVRFLESSLDSLVPRTESLENMVSRIEAAHAAAESLPAEMEDLREAKEELSRLKRESGKDYEQVQVLTGQYRTHLDDSKTHVSQTIEELNKQLENGSSLVKQLDQLHRIGTSTVLAGAFNERATQLNKSLYYWLVVLMVALGAAAWFGHERAGIITELMRTPNAATELLAVQTIMMILGMGAPIWLGWVATK